MRDERQAFLRAIEQDFDDDTPRLVYADWLEENGEADRAEFVRVQCETDRLRAGRLDTDMPAADRHRVQGLTAAANRLLDQHRREWMAGLPKWAVHRVWYNRGFAVVSTITARRLVTDGAAIRRVTPLGGRLHVDRVLGQATVFGCEHLAAITHLSLELADLTDAGARALAVSPHLGRVHTLALDRNPLTDAIAQALAGSNCLPALRELRLFDIQRLTAAGVRAILESPNLSGLTALSLAGGKPGPGVVAAFRSPAARLTGLEALNLGSRRLTDAGAATLADCPALSRLVELNLWGNELTDSGAAAVLRSPHLRNVRRLDLLDNPNITDDTARLVLADGRRWERVTLHHCAVSDQLQAEVAARCEAHR